MKALVIGGARSGTGVALLLKQNGYDVILVSNTDFDTRALLESNDIEVVLNDHYQDRYKDVDLVVKNPGIPNNHHLVKHFNNISNEIEVAASYNPKGTYYAISGTNGKTTTSNLLYEMLKTLDKKALLAGNVGIPLSQKIYEEKDVSHNVALELSSFQMEHLPNFKPKVYALLNLTPDHLNRYESIDEYYKTKVKLMNQAQIFIRNIDDKNIMEFTDSFKGNVIDVSLHKTADVYIKDNQAYYHDHLLFNTSSLKLKAPHNLHNALFASVMAYLAGVNQKEIQNVLNHFSGVKHRLEYITSIDGVQYYNDSKATNQEATEKALQAFDGSIILLAGGKDEGGSFELLQAYNDKVKHAILFGESKYKLQEVFDHSILVSNLNEAYNKAVQLSQKGDVILLSPACASFDQFNNFEERGNAFKNLIKQNN